MRGEGSVLCVKQCDFKKSAFEMKTNLLILMLVSILGSIYLLSFISYHL